LPEIDPTYRLAGISLRLRLVLDCLLAAVADITAHDIARIVGTSVRTIRRDLPEVESVLQSYRLNLRRKAGAGLRVDGPPADRDRLRRDLPVSAIASIRPSDRQAWLVCTLLAAADPVKLHALASDLRITITTVGHDLDTLAPWLASYHLTLLRKRGWGVMIAGAEADCRNAIVDLFFAQFPEPARLALFDPAVRPSPSAGDRILRPAWLLISPARLHATAVLLHELEQVHPPGLEPAERLEFAFNVALVLERASRRRFCAPLPASPPAADSATRVLEWLAPRLTAALALPLPAAELDRLALMLRGAAEPFAAPAAEILPLCQSFLAECALRFGAPLGADPALLDGLLPHLTRTLQRLRSQLPIRNPLLAEIRESYAALFAGVRAAADRVFTAPLLPDTEIGFLVLHLGSALERRRHHRWRALVVCSSGIGTARMLASRLRTELPEIEIRDLLAWPEAARLNPAAYDLVLSTIPLDWPHEHYLVVSPLLQEKDVRDIQAALARRPALPVTGASASGDDGAALGQLDHHRRQAACALALLRDWRIHQVPPHEGPLAALLPVLCEPLVANGTLADSDLPIAQLSARIAQSSLVIPGSRLAFLHARTTGISHASLTLHRLARPLALGDSSVIDQCLLMLAPAKLHRAEVTVLSGISSLLMDPGTLDLLAHGDETATRSHLARQLETALRT
jgi:mannitol operon transcriptional antiterminator